MLALRSLAWLSPLALVLGCATLDAWTLPLADARPELRPGPAADVVIDARNPASGELGIEMAIAGLAASRFEWRGSLEEVQLSLPTFWGADGRRIGYRHERDGLRLERPPGDVVRVRYRARPGGAGRHGRQGIVTPEFASFDGRIFMLPVDAAGLRDVRIRVRMPDGWRVASPFLERGDELAIPGPDFLGDTLAGSCVGLGPYERAARRFGATEVRVFTHALWSESHRARLAEKSFAIFAWFHRELGFDPAAPYAVVWTPDADGERVFGGSYANGTCMEHPTERVRSYELLAHRLGHALNGYPPSGLELRDPADGWFREGWASYVELAATRGSGVTPDDGRWEDLYRRYLRERVSHPERDVPLALEPEARGESTEFLHYVKGPLVVAMLADWIRARAGTSLEAFMAAMWAKHGHYRSALPLRAELASFTGLDLEPFWRRMVEARSDVIPVWHEPRARSGAPVATVGGQPVPEDYLLFLARSGGFRLYADIVSFLEEEERTRALIARHPGAAIYPELPSDRSALSPARRHALARHASDLASTLGARERGPEPPRLRFVPDHPVAKSFATLLAREREYLAALGRRGVSALAVRPLGAAPSLVVPPDAPVLLVAHWLWSPREARAVALEAGRAKRALRVRGARPKGQSASVFPPEARAAGDVIEFELRDGERPLARRAFWQHAIPGAD